SSNSTPTHAMIATIESVRHVVDSHSVHALARNECVSARMPVSISDVSDELPNGYRDLATRCRLNLRNCEAMVISTSNRLFSSRSDVWCASATDTAFTSARAVLVGPFSERQEALGDPELLQLLT
ncbi:MAG: hypothetical protein ABW061_01130, partial [Polyangiaceae bacterium]